MNGTDSLQLKLPMTEALLLSSMQDKRDGVLFRIFYEWSEVIKDMSVGLQRRFF